jgi:hypothetical protein
MAVLHDWKTLGHRLSHVALAAWAMMMFAGNLGAQTMPHVLRKLDSLSTVPTPPIAGINQYIKNQGRRRATG